ncbi:glycoside hydrolase family 73 protein [Butyrivibrio proteoclasticus]|uniref:glycoside hydrolase family 73 protein n=1 Tax=Butyrivibrio proteoclasticus TaxID=43305 RepID=UPI0006877C2C|nr:glucosaminidase domain-containing protein [Butyrivibrio proteoclasticus]
MTTQQKNFIGMIGNAAVRYYRDYGILPSLTIAQAIVESNWGKSGLSRDCHNYFGMKWSNGCGCEYKEYRTKEQKKDGSYITITAKFRKYRSVEEGIKGYYQFLCYKRYKNLVGVTDYEKACDLIRQDGWATALKYSESLKEKIRLYGLMEYDLRVLGVEKESVEAFSPGTYVVTVSAIKVREGAGINYPQKAFKDMTISAQFQNRECPKNGKAVYIKGVVFTAKEIIKNSDDEYWAKTPSGYVALMFGGEEYAKKRG